MGPRREQAVDNPRSTEMIGRLSHERNQTIGRNNVQRNHESHKIVGSKDEERRENKTAQATQRVMLCGVKT